MQSICSETSCYMLLMLHCRTNQNYEEPFNIRKPSLIIFLIKHLTYNLQKNIFVSTYKLLCMIEIFDINKINY
jgi:hypothetical protein